VVEFYLGESPSGKNQTLRRIAMKVQKLFVVAIALAALVLGMLMPLNVSAADKVYELKFAWNDIWGPKLELPRCTDPAARCNAWFMSAPTAGSK